MQGFVRALVLIVVVLLLAAAGAFFVAGRAAAPSITLAQPQKAVGISSTLEIVVDAPAAKLTHLSAALEQSGRRHPLFSLEQPGDATIRQDGPDRVRVTRQFGRRTIPQLQSLYLAIGLALGVTGAWGVARLVAGFLFEIRPHDPIVYSGAFALLAMTGLAAALLPARRAARVDPLIALRME